MPKKKSLWARETDCLVCDAKMLNYQYMTKSHVIAYDEWMVSHPQPIGDYEPYPDALKTTVCPACLFSSNEYSYGVDDYTYFSRSASKNKHLIEFLRNKTDDRFTVFLHEFTRFEHDSAAIDVRQKRPANTRSSATLQKIWQNRDQYGVSFISNILLAPPRDPVTVLVCFTLDRYCQMLRIAHHFDVAPASWDYDALQAALFQRFSGNPLGVKQSEPRFYMLGSNYLQSIQILDDLMTILPNARERHSDLAEAYWRHAHTAIQLCMQNDDPNAVPIETKEGGLNYLAAKLHFKYGDHESGKRYLRLAKNYADNRMKRIASQNQQNFVNAVDDLYKIHFTQASAAKQEVK